MSMLMLSCSQLKQATVGLITTLLPTSLVHSMETQVPPHRHQQELVSSMLNLWLMSTVTMSLQHPYSAIRREHD